MANVTVKCNFSGIEFEGRKGTKYHPEVAKIRKESFRYGWMEECDLLLAYVANEGGYTTATEYIAKVRETRKNRELVNKLISDALNEKMLARDVDTRPDWMNV